MFNMKINFYPTVKINNNNFLKSGLKNSKSKSQNSCSGAKKQILLKHSISLQLTP